MYTVHNSETGEIQCECVSFKKAVLIAQALTTAAVIDQASVQRGDEIKYDTRHGHTEV